MPRKIHNTKTSQTSLGAIKSNFLQQEFLYLTSIKQQGRRSWYKSFRYNISFYCSFFQLYVWHFICLRRHIILLLKTSVEFWTPLEFWRKYSINFKVYAKDAFNFFFHFLRSGNWFSEMSVWLKKTTKDYIDDIIFHEYFSLRVSDFLSTYFKTRQIKWTSTVLKHAISLFIYFLSILSKLLMALKKSGKDMY